MTSPKGSTPLKQSLSQDDALLVRRGNNHEQEEEADRSVGKLTVATAPLTPTDVYSNPHTEEGCNDRVPQSSSTLSSKDADDGQQAVVLGGDYQVPHACSSPYQTFLFSSEWLGSSASGELQLPEMAKTAANGNDETESVGSGGYFEPVDLDSRNWVKAINIDGPTFGFAMVALATALMHPFLFVAGALTAFGTVKAVGAGYEYCSNDRTTCHWDQHLMGICIRDLPAESDYTEKPKEVADSGAVDPDSVIVAPAAKALCETAAQSAVTVIASSQAIQKKNTQELEPNQDGGKVPSQPKKQQVPEAAKQPVTLGLLHKTYPQLDNSIVKDVSFPGLNAIEFFRVFFDDDAPYNFRELQIKRGDVDIVYGKWKEVDPSKRLSLHHDETKDSLPLHKLRYKSFQGRELTFKAKTNNFIGPLYACTRKTQHILLSHKKLVVMESRTDLSEIPFCDRFYVLERWIISADKVNGKYVSTLSATSEVVFTKSCQFASQIKSKSASTIQDLVKCWCTMAKEALKLTEQSKKERLQQQEEEEEEEDSDYEENHHERPEDTRINDENAPPCDDEEGVEVSLPVEKETGTVQIQEQKRKERSRSSLRRPRMLRHCDSAPLPPDHRGRLRPLQGFRRSVSNLWGK